MSVADRFIYKIMTLDEWNHFQDAGIFPGSPTDHADGFIHFSTASQANETANRHFSNQNQVWLVEVDVRKLGGELKWEPSRGGDLFPHLFGELTVNAVTHHTQHVKNQNGEFNFSTDQDCLDS